MKAKDQYANAKAVTNLTASSRRAATAIETIALQVNGLSQKDQDALARAREVLSRVSGALAREAKAKKAEEAALLKCSRDAHAVIKTWPQDSTLDRLALVTELDCFKSCRRIEELTADQFDIANAMHDGAWSAAFEVARSGKALKEVLAGLRGKIEAKKQMPQVIAHAQRLDASAAA